MSAVTNLAIDASRLWATIMETARIGATPKGGVMLEAEKTAQSPQ